MTVILSETKDLTAGMRVCSKQLRINEAKIACGCMKPLCCDERSLAALGMTHRQASDLTIS